ncbi:hypothetical protein Pcinc_006172 [Petrolisthes cinctipes]|uniref:Uncharacterized protein n=1 Tax=Petrolisthes cinctipes TaxID=88211 RepID=A0AAE1FR58_PETCI|nr:hypothetical protein Pcinc_017210 [Petrolisthes cinctipes]KAK3885558.1 hypothetical protein Pcinc_010298 [Petrolisthes cinctipes]KAK3887530.1 hypothetical protein Pcinc_008348 [Petrolisthes cinctipes]KAK3889846.1 hypothetical protein Pcinc_006172 [Petrolisthes cinctipes]
MGGVKKYVKARIKNADKARESLKKKREEEARGGSEDREWNTRHVTRHHHNTTKQDHHPSFKCLEEETTQNQNEHLHSRVWRYFSKYKNANKTILDFATAKAVFDYNAGYKEGNIQPLLGLQCTNIGQSALERKDRKRESLCGPRGRKRCREDCKDYAAGGF